MLGTFFLGLFGYYTYKGFPYAPWTELNGDLKAAVGDQEIVLHSNKISALPAHYYDSVIDHRYLPDPPGSGSDTLAPATQEVLNFMAEETLKSAVHNTKGVWFVIFPREKLDYLAEGFQDHPTLEQLSEMFALESVSSYGELEAYHFVR